MLVLSGNASLAAWTERLHWVTDLEEDLTVLRIHVPLLTPCPWSLASWRWPRAPKNKEVSSQWPLSVRGCSGALQTRGSFPEAPAKPAASSGSRWPAGVRAGGTKASPSNKDEDGKGEGATGAHGTRRAPRLLGLAGTLPLSFSPGLFLPASG